MIQLKTNILLVKVAALLLPIVAGMASGETLNKGDFAFVNVADTTAQGFVNFGIFPAINNAGAVAFQAVGSDFDTGAVFKWDNKTLTTIASSADDILTSFGESVAIAPSGLVAFSARVTSSNGNTIIATGKGEKIKIIVDANQQGIVGGAFLGLSGMNNSGTVVVRAFRRGFASQGIFAGDGGPLAVLVDTRTSPFTSLGAADINASGAIVFQATLSDETVGLFGGVNGSTVVADSRNPSFDNFLDPVMNDAGAVGSAAFLRGGGMQVFTSEGGRLTPRNNPASPFFTFADNVCINNSGDVAFFGSEATGEQGIFIETTGGDSPIPVIKSGDRLFGSTVTGLSLGRFSLNDHDQISFQYRLADGRSGIAIAYPDRQHAQAR